MKARLLRRLHKLIIQMVSVNDEELDKIGVELADIEKKLIAYNKTK